MKHPSSLRAMTSLLAACGLLTACVKKTETKKPVMAPAKVSTVQEFDVNGDGKKDAWRHYKIIEGKKVLSHKRFDLNFDGKADLTRFYSESGAVERDEMDMDFDGKVDMICYFENNKLVRKELMTVRGTSAKGSKPNSTLTLKEYKTNGQANYLESDQDRDGVNDTFFYFKDGRIVRQGFDLNGDGQPDNWEELE